MSKNIARDRIWRMIQVALKDYISNDLAAGVCVNYEKQFAKSKNKE